MRVNKRLFRQNGSDPRRWSKSDWVHLIWYLVTTGLIVAMVTTT